MMNWIFLVALLCVCEQIVQSYNILAIFPLQSSSHYVMYERILKALVAKGHTVDVVSHFPQKVPLKGYNDLSIAGSLPSFVNNVSLTDVKDLTVFESMEDIMVLSGYESCEPLFNTSTLQNLKKSTKKYDLFLTEIFGTDCMLGFAHIFDIPIVELMSSVNLPWSSDRIGNPDNPSYIPNYFLPYLSKMSLWERLINTLTLLISKYSYDRISMENSNPIAKKFFGEDLPDLREIAQKTSLILVNSHFSINIARPTVPNFIEVAGLHINEPKTLPEELKTIVEGSKDGVIYFSTGSMLRSETFETTKLQAMFDAFKELSSYTILWKAKRERFPEGLNIPSNIQFREWMPQLDILCQPNVKLFISHGGLMGTQEAIYCGIPILGIPMFADQFLNAKQSVAIGISKLVQYESITKESFLDAAKTLLERPKYKKTAESISKKFKDRPNTPLDSAIFWIEYVTRHKGAPELRSIGADLPFYQYLLLDIILVIIASVIITTILIYYLTCLSLQFMVFILLRSAESTLLVKNKKKQKTK